MLPRYAGRLADMPAATGRASSSTPPQQVCGDDEELMMTSANNGSGKTWSAIIDCYAIAFGVLPAAAGPDTDTVRHGPCADE